MSRSGGPTERNQYYCDWIAATFIVPEWLLFPNRCKDIEFMFGMCSFKMCAIFYEVLEAFIEARSHLQESFRSYLWTYGAETYEAGIHEEEVPLDICVGYIDCTNTTTNIEADYLTYKWLPIQNINFLSAFSIRWLPLRMVLVFHLYGPEVEHRHDMNLHLQSGLDDKMRNIPYPENKQFLCMEIEHTFLGMDSSIDWKNYYYTGNFYTTRVWIRYEKQCHGPVKK